MKHADEFAEVAHLECLAQADAIRQEVKRATSRQAGVTTMFVERFSDGPLLAIQEVERLRTD
jgi:hypothetical protein